MKKIFLAKLTTVALVAVAVASSFRPMDGDPIKVGVYGPFSGGSAPMGLSMRNGVRLAVNEINAAGGVMGRKIELVERDDEAKNERGGQIMQELLFKEEVSAILGPINTGVADASTKYSNEKKVPQIINVAAGAKVNDLFATTPDNYIFRIAANDYVQSEMIIREALQKRKFKKPALLCDDTNYGQGGRAKMEAALAKRKVTPVSVGKFKLKDTDMTAQLQEAKAAGADVLLVYGIGPELAAIANNLEKIGWKVQIIGGWTLSMSNFINNAGKNGNGATMPQTFIENGAVNGKAAKFLAAYEAAYKEKNIPVAVAAAQGYDSVYLLKMAIEQAGSTDGPKVKAALENFKKGYVGVTGTYKKPFSATDHEAIHEANVVMGVVKDGIVVPPIK